MLLPGEFHCRARSLSLEASQQSEYIYELSASVLNKHGGSEEISNELYALAGVQNVNLVCQNDEITA